MKSIPILVVEATDPHKTSEGVDGDVLVLLLCSVSFETTFSVNVHDFKEALGWANGTKSTVLVDCWLHSGANVAVDDCCTGNVANIRIVVFDCKVQY